MYKSGLYQCQEFASTNNFFFLAIYSAIVEFHFVLFTSIIDYIFGVIEKDCPAVL